jgi:hypothetical protein
MKRILLSVLAIAALIAMIACGGGGSSSTTTPSASSAPVTINVGDATADRLVAFEVTVNSVTLTGSAGSTSNLLSAPAKVELTHLSGKFEPLRLASIPAGSYTGATFQLGSAEAVIISSTTGLPVKKENITPNPATVPVTFNPALNLSAAGTVLNFDFNLGTSVNVAADDTVTFTPSPSSITVVTRAAGAKAENEQEDEDGEIEDLQGTIQGAPANNQFTVALANGQTLTFNVDANTEFSDGLSGFASLTAGMVVKLEGVTRQDGSLLAKEVEGSEVQAGVETDGIIVATTPVTGTPVTAINMVVNESMSSQAIRPAADNTIHVTISGVADNKFIIDFGRNKTKVDGSAIQNAGLLFDRNHIGVGQKVEADDPVAKADQLTPEKLKLQKQALVGTWTVSGSNITLALSTDNFFRQLTNETSVTVIAPQNAILKNGTPATGTANVRVRGLLFFNPSAAPGTPKYTLVAIRIDNR